MPQLAPLFATAGAFVASNSAAALGFSVAAQASIAAGAASVGSIIGGLAIPIGLSLAASAIFRPEQPKPSDGQREIQQPIPPRIIHYGRVKVSGPLLFYESRTDPVVGNSALWKIVALSAREIDAIETLHLNDNVVTVDVDGWVVEDQYRVDGDGRVRITQHLGTDGQTYDTVLGAAFSEWTSDHRLRGIAYVMVECISVSTTLHNTTYPNGEPNFSALIRGAKLFDPRESGHDPDDKTTWTWSDNAGLAVLDWLTYGDGYGRYLGFDALDLSSFVDHAYLCDELVDLAAGGTEKRYRIAASASLMERRTDVLTRLREASDAKIVRGPSGLIGIRGGKWSSPSVAIAMGAGVGGRQTEVQISDGADALSRYNELAIRYMSPDHGYTEVEGDPWRDEAAIAEAGGVVETRSLDLLQVPSHGQARRLAKIIMARDNPKWLGQVRTDFSGLELMYQDRVALGWDEIDDPDGEFNGPFLIDPGLAAAADGTGMIVPVRAADPTSYDWDEDTEEGDAPPIPADTSSEFDPGVAPAIAEDVAAADGTGEAVVTWTAPNDEVFVFAKVWRAASGGAFGTATDVSGPRYGASNQAMAFTDVVTAGAYDYFVTTHNAAGVRNNVAGPDGATVS